MFLFYSTLILILESDQSAKSDNWSMWVLTWSSMIGNWLPESRLLLVGTYPPSAPLSTARRPPTCSIGQGSRLFGGRHLSMLQI